MEAAKSEKKVHLSWYFSAFFSTSDKIKEGVSLNIFINHSWTHPKAYFNSWKKRLMVFIFHEPFNISPQYMFTLKQLHSVYILHYYISILVIHLPEALGEKTR